MIGKMLDFIKRRNIGKYMKALIGLLVFAFFVKAGYDRWRFSQAIDYRKERNTPVVMVDGKPITFSDLAYIILVEEKRTEDQARIYNPNSPKDYWNTNDKGKLLAVRVRNSAIDMAVHDRILYELAEKENIKLSKEDEEFLKDKQIDFWEDLYDEQHEKLYVKKSVVNEELRKVAIVSKYQQVLAMKAKVNSARFSYDGDKYKEILKKHKVKINKPLVKKIKMGDVTLVHKKVNFVH